MIKSTFLILFTWMSFSIYAQSFEGKLTYSVNFRFDSLALEKFGLTEQDILQEMKDDGDYYDTITVILKGGNYIKEDNSDKRKKIVYVNNLNKIFLFQKNDESVIVTDGTQANPMNLDFKEPAIEKIDTVKNIYNKDCHLIKLSWGGLGEELYYYHPELLKIDAGLFSKHHYEYLDTVLALTQSYPVEIEKSLGNLFSARFTLVAISEEKIDDKLFEIPQLKKAEKESYNMMKELTGTELMIIKK